MKHMSWRWSVWYFYHQTGEIQSFSKLSHFKWKLFKYNEFSNFYFIKTPAYEQSSPSLMLLKCTYVPDILPHLWNNIYFLLKSWGHFSNTWASSVQIHRKTLFTIIMQDDSLQHCLLLKLFNSAQTKQAYKIPLEHHPSY